MDYTRLLQRLIWETVLEEEIRLSQRSLDDQVDSILLRFESDCIVDVASPGEDQTAEARLSLLPLILELKDEEKDDDEKDDDDAGSQKPELGDPDEEEKEDVKNKTGDVEDAQPDGEADPLRPKIDLGKFAGKVARLVVNYEALLDLPIAIVNRARNYLEQNYGLSVAKEFMEMMEQDYDVVVDRKGHKEPREHPLAVGAAASGLS